MPVLHYPQSGRFMDEEEEVGLDLGVRFIGVVAVFDDGEGRVGVGANPVENAGAGEGLLYR